jgi:uncharacterized protein (DUF486 family)
LLIKEKTRLGFVLELMQKLLLLTHSLLFPAFRWFFCEFQYLLVVLGGWGFVQHSYCLSLLADYLKPGMSVLDVGSGSGYLTAVLGLMVCLHTSQTKHFFTPPSLLCYHFTRLNQQKKSPWDISCNNHFTRLLSEEMSGHSKHDDLMNLQRQATHAWRWVHGGLNFFLFFSYCGDVT